MMLRVHALLVAAMLAGAPRAGSIPEAWLMLPETGNACGRDLAYDRGTSGGMRNFFCRALTVFSWKKFLSLAPVAPFLSGPHQHGKLKLDAKKEFGRYNPEFVRWATGALIPDGEFQGVYDGQMRELARVYFMVWRAISADGQWLPRERGLYGAEMAKGEADWGSPVVDLYLDTLGPEDHNWGGYEPSQVRSATMWWLRRSIDETAPLWAEGLERLLGKYDAAWLKGAKAKKPSALPKRSETPEYRR
jgi:hypothetical protein